MALPQDYETQVYAGVLGKIIGVYLGRPFEGWTNERIESELGEIHGYVHEKVGVRLIVTDDDISGTFTFLRALDDYGCDPGLSPAAIGQTWLNYLIEERTVLWWGGLGNSTEHTAFLRLKQGIQAPESGSMGLNGQVVAEQIGAQIFIDGWAMVCPGDPERAADFARRAASVSHDGAAIHGAQVIAAIEAAAFVEKDINRLIDIGLEQIPDDALLATMIANIRDWHAANGDDWRASFGELRAKYGYDKYGGNCHMVPNHGLIILSLLHGNGDFSRTQMIVNTAGWDTDCNAGNAGCIMGLVAGLEGIDAGVDWRGPLRDRLYIPTADGGRAISDAVTEAMHIAAIGRRLAGEAPLDPCARFHFGFPGAVQGFARSDDGPLANVTIDAGRALEAELSAGAIATLDTPVFCDSLDTARYFERRGYALLASPTLNAGQTLEAVVSADVDITAAVAIQVFDADDALVEQRGPETTVSARAATTLTWTVPDVGGYPIARAGVTVTAQDGASVRLHSLDWHGDPRVTLERVPGRMWHRAWVNGVDTWLPRYPEAFRLIQNSGTGLALYGCRSWRSYAVGADVTPHLVRRAGVAARVQGMRRYYALVLNASGKVQLVRALDGDTVLAEVDRPLEFGVTANLRLEADGTRLRGWIDDTLVVEAEDDQLAEGGVALLVDEGRTATQRVTIEPLAG